MIFEVNRRMANAIASAFAVMAGMAIQDGLIAARPSIAVPLRLAQATATLTERADQIDTCRGTGDAPQPIYKNTGLNGVIGTVPANSSVTLTGVFGTGIVQIRVPQVGWVSSATLRTNCSSPPESGFPADLDTNPKYCRRIRSSQSDGPAYVDLDNGLVARNTPNGSIQFVGTTTQADGPAGAAIVRFPSRASDVQDAGDRRWIRVKYISISGTPRIGWVANGPVGMNRNIAACSGNQQ